MISTSQANHGAVCRKRLAGGQQNQFLRQRLGHQHPIEGIAMKPRKQPDLAGVRGQQGQALEGLGGQPLGEIEGQADRGSSPRLGRAATDYPPGFAR